MLHAHEIPGRAHKDEAKGEVHYTCAADHLLVTTSGLSPFTRGTSSPALAGPDS